MYTYNVAINVYIYRLYPNKLGPGFLFHDLWNLSSKEGDNTLQQECQFAASIAAKNVLENCQKSCGNCAAKSRQTTFCVTATFPRSSRENCREYFRQYCREYCRAVCCTVATQFAA
jgi:hypothetical protein